VSGVLVGQTTVTDGDSVHTGITAIRAHGGNQYLDRVPAAVHVGNAFGKLVGSTQVKELGELETPILLTCTLCVWKAADAMVEWMIAQPGMERVGSLNPVVGETNDGGLNAIRSRPIRPEHVRAALDGAKSGPVAEGSVGAGAGTQAFGWKGGIGTSSRVVPKSLGGYTVGVLVQSNFGGILQVLGAPVGKELGRYAFKNEMDRERATRQQALHGCNVFGLIRRQSFVREDRITEAFQLPFEELALLLPVVAALGKIHGRLARYLRLAIAVASAPRGLQILQQLRNVPCQFCNALVVTLRVLLPVGRIEFEWHPVLDGKKLVAQDILGVLGNAVRLYAKDSSFVEPFMSLPLAILPTFVVPIVIVSHVLLFSWVRLKPDTTRRSA